MSSLAGFFGVVVAAAAGVVAVRGLDQDDGMAPWLHLEGQVVRVDAHDGTLIIEPRSPVPDNVASGERDVTVIVPEWLSLTSCGSQGPRPLRLAEIVLGDLLRIEGRAFVGADGRSRCIAGRVTRIEASAGDQAAPSPSAGATRRQS